MNRRGIAFLAALVLTGCSTAERPAAPVAPVAPRIALGEVGDSVMYLELSRGTTILHHDTGTLVVTSRHTAVIHVTRTAPDSLEGFYEHLLIRFEGGNQTRTVDTAPLIGPRFVLQESNGRIKTVSTPPVPAEIRQMTDLRRQFDDFFLRLPGRPLDVGVEWVDTIRFSANEAESRTERLAVTRFRVRGDTVVDGIAARVIDYESALETRMRSGPTTQGILATTLVGGEAGWFVFAPGPAVMLRRNRVGSLDGEFVIEGNLETRRFPQNYHYESRIELIPPPAAAAVAAPTLERVPVP